MTLRSFCYRARFLGRGDVGTGAGDFERALLWRVEVRPYQELDGEGSTGDYDTDAIITFQGTDFNDSMSYVTTGDIDADGTPEGVFSRVLRKGTGTRNPGPNDTVTVHYSGWTTDGKMFDSSVTRGQPATFKLNEVIPGWTIGVGRMVEGEQRRLWIPEKLAYQGQPGAPAGMLVFDVELIRIE